MSRAIRSRRWYTTNSDVQVQRWLYGQDLQMKLFPIRIQKLQIKHLCKEMRCFALSNYKHSKTGKKRLIVWKTSECMVFPQQLKAGFESWLLIARKSNSSYIKEFYSPLFNQGVKSFTPLFNLQIACYIQKFCFLLEKQRCQSFLIDSVIGIVYFKLRNFISVHTSQMKQIRLTAQKQVASGTHVINPHRASWDVNRIKL